MIIVSQDEKAVINFDNVNEIRVSTNKIIMFDNTYRSPDDCSDILGIYATEERAKEVLQNIIRFYEVSKRYESSAPVFFFEKSFVYKMPEIERK